MDGFISKIVDQCREVLNRHDRLTVEQYMIDEVYRTLEMEMVELKVRESRSESLTDSAALLRLLRWRGTALPTVCLTVLTLKRGPASSTVSAATAEQISEF